MAPAAKKSTKKTAAQKVADGDLNPVTGEPYEEEDLEEADEVEGAVLQLPAVREDILNRAPSGDSTATGREKAFLSGAQDEARGEEEGSILEVIGGPEFGDFAPVDSMEPFGAQAAPANWATNGSLPVNQVASPSGPVPVSSLGLSPEDSLKKLTEQRDAQRPGGRITSKYQPLSRNQVERMSGSELRAVAHDRGYEMSATGNRSTRRSFLDKQKAEFKKIEKEEKESSGDDKKVPR